MDLLFFLFGFTGRINRGKYWLALVLYTAAWIAFAVVAIKLLRVLDKDDPFDFLGGGLALWVSGLSLALMVLWSSLATGVKRLHDRDKSGWWILLFWFGPSLLGGSNQTMEDSPVSLVLALIGLGIAIWGFVELGCLRGTRGPNQYGTDPLEPQGTLT